ncbi:hypothetical protein [Paraburkholderia sp. BL10I2N1]|uniref:hypothetical protein n=1 Tax=Paraburkholderia sp. BL10I2N1 TaxID=1938796 RepID=UPI001FB667F2|nr:hypothetical protein [Paraburkholderia sp. BL10I2N1]
MGEAQAASRTAVQRAAIVDCIARSMGVEKAVMFRVNESWFCIQRSGQIAGITGLIEGISRAR